MPDHLSPMFDAADEEVARYRAVSSLALAGLFVGLLSPLALLTGVLWLVPLTAIVLSGLALRRIAVRSPDLVGRPAAVAGLLLGVAFLVAAPVDDLVYRYYIRQQARQFAQIWIDAVQHGEVYKAHQLTVDPQRRRPLESNLADYYRLNPKPRELLNLFVKEPATRSLFALGRDAKIRFYEPAGDGLDSAQLTYAVTFPDKPDQPKTFFITLVLQRFVDNNGRANWTMAHVSGGVRPRGW